jgi:hypothetical protein
VIERAWVEDRLSHIADALSTLGSYLTPHGSSFDALLEAIVVVKQDAEAVRDLDAGRSGK